MSQSRIEGRVEGFGRRRRAEDYARLLGEQTQSGLSLRAFARERGLSLATLYRWRGKVELADKSGRGAGGGLVAVELVGERRKAAEQTGAFEVLLANGTRVRLPAEFAAARLAELFSVLGAC